MVWQDFRERGGPADEWATPGNFVDWRNETRLFDSLAAVGGWRPTLTSTAEPESLPGEQVTYEYFSVLGVTPAIGRDFSSADDVPNAPRVALIGDDLWKRRFGGNREVVGEVVTLSGEPHQIIGVLPPQSRPVIASDAEIWRPIRMNRADPARGAIVLRVVARLAAGLTLAQAQAAASALADRLQAAHPEFNERVGFNLQPLHARVTGQIRPGLLALAGGVAFVLLIACANIANLLTTRGSSRGRELAVRAALGAGRGRMIRQLLIESLVLAVLGGLAGIVVARWAVEVLVAMAPANAPRLDEVSLDATVLAFTALLTVVTGVVFGLVPALQHSRVDVTDSLKDGGRGTIGTAGGRVRQALITAEVALALVLLTGGALLIQTFVRLQSADLGFRTEGLLVGFVNPPRVSYDSQEKYIALYDRLLEEAAAIPGVQQAAVSSVLPLATGDSDTNFAIEGRPAPPSPSDVPVTWYRQVSAGYFDAIGMRLVRGRGFGAREAAPSVVVNETLVRRYFPGEDPIGRRLRFARRTFSIIGVVADARVAGARAETRVETFVPYWQLVEGGVNIVLRGDNPTGFAAPLRQVVSSLDRNVPVVGLQTMAAIFSESVGQPRFFALLAGAFAALALLLAAIGIYGVMAYGVTQRTAEMALRMALGATATEVFRGVMIDGLKLAVVGVMLGVAGAVVVTRSLTALLFDVAPNDPLVLAGTTAVLLTVAALATFIPAWRATRVEPMVALRAE
jgi:putative ABC transport system permease protein